MTSRSRGGRAQRRGVEGTRGRQVADAAEQRDRSEVQDHFRRPGDRERHADADADRSEIRDVEVRRKPGPATVQLCRFWAKPTERDRRSGGEQLLWAHLALLHQQRQARHAIARHAVRDHRLQARRQILRRAQQRVRLRQLRDHPRAEGGEPAEGDAQGRPALKDAPMPGRRSFQRAGWLKLCFALALPLFSTGAAACPLCYEAARQMMTEGVQLDMAPRAVLAAPEAGGGPFRIVAVVKGSDALGGMITEPVTEAGDAAPAAGEPTLLIHDPAAPQWTSLGAIPLMDADWLRRIAATREVAGERPRRIWPLTTSTADALSYAGWRQRVTLVLP